MKTPGFIFGLTGFWMLLVLASQKSCAPQQATDPRTDLEPHTDAAKIAKNALAAGDDVIRNQAVWLNDNGCPETSAAMFKYLNGDVPASYVMLIANQETKKFS